jgi:hypothetical protein
LEALVREVAEALGCGSAGVRANLYKLLLYEPGGFFKPHKVGQSDLLKVWCCVVVMMMVMMMMTTTTSTTTTEWRPSGRLGSRLKAIMVGAWRFYLQDTEKEDGMFGTLVIQLPTAFQGGRLTYKHKVSGHEASVAT